MKRKSLILSCIFVQSLFFILNSCQHDKPRLVSKPLDVSTTINEIYLHESYPKNFTRNDLGVAYIQDLLHSAGQNLMEIRLALVEQFINNNQVEEAISIGHELLDALQNYPDSMSEEVIKFKIELYFQLALANLRKGELQNCRDNHHPTSCILPFSGQAIHTDKSGADSAIYYLKKVLQHDLGNVRCMWLLNVIAESADRYPEAVPEKFRVNLEKYTRGNTFLRFKQSAAEKGLDHFGHLGGVAIEDFNNDSYPDVMSTSFVLNEPVKLYLQSDKGFEDHSEAAGLDNVNGGTNLFTADYNNDGLIDVFITRGGWLGRGGFHPPSLLKNLGAGKFKDVTIQAGLLSFKPSQTACWGDFDNDGFLDLFVGRENNNAELDASCSTCFSQLYHNNGDGTFTNVGKECGIVVDELVKGCVWFDFNNDGKLDLYISNYGSSNLLFRNDGPNIHGNVHFTQVADECGVNEPEFSFPVAAFDINQDGWEDLFVPGYKIRDIQLALEYTDKVAPASPVKIFINQKDGTFREMAAEFGINRSIYAMALNYGDLDLDGFPDVYIGTGLADYAALFPNILLHNQDGNKFSDVTSASGTGSLQKGHGVAISDIDRDGDNDIYANIGGFFSGDTYWNVLFENPGTNNAWISLKLEGTKTNRSAIGSRVKVNLKTPSGKRVVYSTISTGGSFGSSALQQLIGLGNAASVESIEIRWAGTNQTIVYRGFKIRKAYLIVEGRSAITELPYSPIESNPASPQKKKHHPL